ncbi:MAG: GAF domain-containing protein, partial [Chloroflexi bacterium]|nr:GAF domain-containing protein [Chloroflexota bacterium]
RLLRRVRERLEMLTRIGQEVGQSLQLETVLDTLYTQLKAIFGADIWPNVLLYDEVSHNLHFLYPEKFELSIDVKGRQGQMMIKSSQGICGWVAKHKQALNVPDVKTEPRYLEMLQTTRSELTVPILLGERLVGVLDIESSEPGKFKEDDQRLLEAVANQVAAAIRNAEQYESLKKSRQQQRALHEAGKASTRAGLGVGAVLQAILDQAVAVTGANFGTIHLLQENHLEFVAAWPTERLEWLRREIGRMPLDGPGITVRAVKLNDAQLVSDISRDPDFVNSTGETGSELAVVLRRGGHREGQLIGVLNVEHQEVGGLDREDRNLLITLSNMAVVALQNAEQYEELQEARDYGLATEAVAWLGLFGADWQHTINQKTFSIGNYIDALHRGMAKYKIPPDVLDMVDQALDGIEDVTNSIRTVQFTGRVPSETPGEANGGTEIDSELSTVVTRWCHDRDDVKKVFNLNCSGIYVRIPPQWLRVALEKLINNALKAMPNGGKITVSTHQIDDVVRISIEDTGHGIPDYAQADFLKGIIHRPKGTKMDGTGKGALIARFVARSYGGDLRLAHTQQGKGTGLLMTLPMLINNSNS